MTSTSPEPMGIAIRRSRAGHACRGRGDRGGVCPPRPRRWTALLATAALLGAALGPLACSSYTTRLRGLRPAVSVGDLDKAAERIEGETRPGELLHHLERGLLSRLAGDFDSSNADLGAAETLLEDLYTISVSRRTLTFLVHDEADAYRGEVHEANYLHFYRILNFLALGEHPSAVVEARRLGLRLERLRAENPDAPEVRDPFLEFLTGAFFETAGEWNDALIAYRLAAQAWSDAQTAGGAGPPPWLAGDMRRAARQAGIGPGEVPELLLLGGRDGPIESSGPEGREGDLLVLFESGWTPSKMSEHIRVPIVAGDLDWQGEEGAADAGWVLQERYRGHRGEGDWNAGRTEIRYFLDAAIPVLASPPETHAATCRITLRPVSVAGPSLGPFEVVPVADLALRARLDFDLHEPAILARTFARALIKYLAKRQVEKEAGTWAGVLANIAGVATEKADTRSWLLLPGRISAARIRAPAGSYSLELAVIDGEGRLLDETNVGVEVQERGIAFVSWRSFE
ncbi:MAG: hypothetical protein V1774_11215 [Candidatus Eisenbacteria bacterium]